MNYFYTVKRSSAKHIIIRITACFMIGIMGLLLANDALFMHSHKIANGFLIRHAHPYDTTNDTQPVKSHHHTPAELLFFQDLGVFFLLVLPTVIFYQLTIAGKEPIYTFHFVCSGAFIFKKVRAPPVP